MLTLLIDFYTCGFNVSKTKWIKEHMPTYKKNEGFEIEVIFNLWLTSLN